MLFEEGVNAQAFMRGPELARAVGAGVNRFYHADAMRTVQALTNASGATEAAYFTDPWGNVVSGSAAGNPYVYQGGLGYWDEPDLGLSYVRARWLDPATGSWLSVDPVSGEPRYSYARKCRRRGWTRAGRSRSRGKTGGRGRGNTTGRG